MSRLPCIAGPARRAHWTLLRVSLCVLVLIFCDRTGWLSSAAPVSTWSSSTELTRTIRTSKHSAIPPGTNLTCKWRHKDEQLEAYFVNLDRSSTRRQTMDELLSAMGLTHTRVRAVSVNDIVIPDDIRTALEAKNPHECVHNSSWDPSRATESSSNGNVRESGGGWSPYRSQNKKAMANKIYIKGACGSVSNSIKELVTVVSHLLAIRTAVYSETSTSRYALILEDDVWTPFDIDFYELLEQMPDKGFGMIQLFNSKPLIAGEMIHRYKKMKMLWYVRPEDFGMRHLPSFSTGAYLINREVMKPIIDAILEVDPTNGWTAVRILAGTTLPTCKPSNCCPPKADGSTPFNQSIPHCIWAPVGYQADSFLYALARTYVFTIPLFVDGQGSSDSTIHQSHVIHQHKIAFQKIREFVNSFLTEEIPLPFYIQRACPKEILMSSTQS